MSVVDILDQDHFQELLGELCKFITINFLIKNKINGKIFLFFQINDPVHSRWEKNNHRARFCTTLKHEVLDAIFALRFKAYSIKR